jgi:hypothetical protein
MEGIGLDSMLGAEEVEKLFGEQATSETENVEGEKAGEETPADKGNSEQEQAAEVDFSDLLGNNQPESVGSEETTEGNRGAPESENDQGTPTNNLFSSIAKALRDEGVFPDLSDDTLNGISDAESLRKMFDDQISKTLDERQQRLENAMNSGATSKELNAYQNALNIMQNLESRDTQNLLTQEGDEGDDLRKRLIYQDYVNRGFKHEKAVKMLQKILDDGTEIEEAKEAYESCKEFYKSQIDDFQKEMESRKAETRKQEEKQYASLKKHILDTESFYGGVKVDKGIRQKAYDAITKPVYKDNEGNYMTALQKYQRENPMEFMENVAMLYSLTDGFKSVDRLAKGKVKEGLKKGFAELESVLQNTRRNSDGTLNLANTPPDDSEREKWSLAM